jgi:uncharacterized protein YutD
VVLVLSILIRYAESLGTYQYCVGDWPNEMVYLTNFLKQHLELIQINCTSETSLTSYIADIQAHRRPKIP